MQGEEGQGRVRRPGAGQGKKRRGLTGKDEKGQSRFGSWLREEGQCSVERGGQAG